MFSWKSDFKETEYDFEIARDEKFSSVVIASSETAAKKNVNCSLRNLPAGQYFWRVARSGDGKRFYSDTRLFSVEQAAPDATALIYPPDNFTVETEKLPLIPFSWKVADELKNENTECVLQISSREDFGAVDFEKTVSDIVSQRVSRKGISLPEGNWYWRVKLSGKNPRAETGHTEPHAFSVVTPLETPEFIFPKNNSEYIITSESMLYIGYGAVPGADFYKIRIFDEATDELVAKIDSTPEVQPGIKLPPYAELKKGKDSVRLRCSVTAYANEKENAPMCASKNAALDVGVVFSENVVLRYPQDAERIPRPCRRPCADSVYVG